MNWTIQRSHFQVLDSTQEEIRKIVSDLKANTIASCTANSQLKGRATHNRSWTSPPDVNIYVSFAFKINHLSTMPIISINLPQIVGLSVAKTLQYYKLKPQLKWVNDVLINNKKIGGILCEASTLASETIYTVGIGLNINMSKEDCDLHNQPVTSMIVETNKKFDKEMVYQILEKNFVDCIELYFNHGFKYLFPDIDKLIAFKNEVITFDPQSIGKAENFIQGYLLGIDIKGQLCLQLPNGDIKKFLSGRIWREPNFY